LYTATVKVLSGGKSCQPEKVPGASKRTRTHAVAVKVLSRSIRRYKCLSKKCQAIGKRRENKRTKKEEEHKKELCWP
jgi:hypothetical protein